LTVDLHCHILPGIDDGAADLSDSLAMARQAAEDGVEAICATPHIRHDHAVRIDELGTRTRDLNAELAAAGIPVSAVRGGELAETVADDLDDEELSAIALGGGRWLLLEPAAGPLSDSLEQRVGRLASRGFRSLIAHPERHAAGDLRERLLRLIEAGALIQATADFLLREETAPLMLDLAGHGLLHVLGSDSHSARIGRPVRLAPALQVLTEVERLRPHLEWVRREAPEAIISGSQTLEPPFVAG
jgi:protein-tyrosine phosphatase